MAAQKSTFPVALGVRITGVDDSTFSQTGESYSMITMPNADSHNARVLQEDNTELVRRNLTPTHTTRLLRPLLCCAGLRVRAQVPFVQCRSNQLTAQHTYTPALTMCPFCLQPATPPRIFREPPPTQITHQHPTQPFQVDLSLCACAREKGIHEVAARRFCLVAADHPLVSAVCSYPI